MKPVAPVTKYVMEVPPEGVPLSAE